MFPVETPLGDDLDFAFLAAQFPLSGGFIKNAALAVAFPAAADVACRGACRSHLSIPDLAGDLQDPSNSTIFPQGAKMALGMLN